MALGAPVPTTTGAVDSLASTDAAPASDASLEVVTIGASVTAASFTGVVASLDASSGRLAASSALASEPEGEGEGDEESLEKQPPATPASVVARHASEKEEKEVENERRLRKGAAGRSVGIRSREHLDSGIGSTGDAGGGTPKALADVGVAGEGPMAADGQNLYFSDNLNRQNSLEVWPLSGGPVTTLFTSGQDTSVFTSAGGRIAS